MFNFPNDLSLQVQKKNEKKRTSFQYAFFVSYYSDDACHSFLDVHLF